MLWGDTGPSHWFQWRLHWNCDAVSVTMASIFNWLLNSGTVPLFSSICHLLPACCFCVFLNMPISYPVRENWWLERSAHGMLGQSFCISVRRAAQLLHRAPSSSCVPIAPWFGCADHKKDELWHLILSVVLHSDAQKLLASEMTFTFPASVLLKLLGGYCLGTKNVYFSS